MANEAQADTYFATRLNATAWTGTNKTPALWTAYHRLIDCADYDLSATTPTSEPLRRAQCEMAYYMLKHLSAEDHRLGIQAQGVISAGIVQEAYKEEMKVPIPAIVDDILSKAGFKKYKAPFKMIAIGRDDTLDSNDKITEYSEN
jgi:hypothetical protein